MHDDAEPREAHERRAQMLDAGVGDADLGPRHGGESDERSDLDVIRADAVRRAAERASAVDRELVRADAVDLRAERDEEVAEVLDVRLAGGVAKDRRAARRDGRRERVLGAGDARLVEEDVGAAEPWRATDESCRSSSNAAPSRSSARKCVSTRRRPMTSPPGGGSSIWPQRASSGPASRIDARIFRQRLGIEARRRDGLARGCASVLRAVHSTSTPERRDELDERLDVADARDVLERDRMFGEQRRADDRQRGVLVAGRTDGAGEPLPALDDELQCAHVRVTVRKWIATSEEWSGRRVKGQWRERTFYARRRA